VVHKKRVCKQPVHKRQGRLEHKRLEHMGCRQPTLKTEWN
jgi:hypothetical protein